MAGIKIVDLPALGRDLLSTDLLEMSIGGTASRKITGQEIMNASKLNVGSTPIVSGTVGRLLFQGTGNVLQQSSSLSFDSATNRFQVGSNVNILAANTFPTNLNSPYVVLGPYNANFGGDQGALFNLTNNSTTGNSAAIFRFGITSPATGAIGEFGATSSTFSGFPSLVFFNTKGTFPLAFLTNDTERLRIHGTTGNVLINTTTDAGFRLDVNGTARVQGNVTVSGNTTITGSFIANSAGTGYEGYKIQDGANTRFVAQRIVTNVLGIGHTSTVGTWNDVILGAVQTLGFYTGTSERARIASTGNLLINTTTDAGFRLDVNGTVRSQGNLFFGTAGSYLLGDTNNIRIVDKNNTIILQSFPNGVSNSETYLRSANSTISFLRLREDYISLEYNNGAISQTTQNPIQITRGFFGNVLATDKSVLHIRSPFFSNLNNATTLRGIFIDINDTTTFTGFTTVRAIEAPRGGAYFNTTSPQASAVLQADSISQGFLPPRMTNAQRTAIVSPAVGLIVYCTDVTEGLWVYKSTGWTFIV